MAVGRNPFDGETSGGVIASILECEPPPLARYAEVPAELERIVRKALSKDPAKRYQRAGDMADDLKSLKQELDVEARLKTTQQSAYERYLKGRYFFDKRTVGGFRRSKEYFQEAIKKDPNYALAWAGLANAYTPSDFMLLPKVTMKEAKTAAKRALELDDTLAEAHTARVSRIAILRPGLAGGGERTQARGRVEPKLHRISPHVFALFNLPGSYRAIAHGESAGVGH